MHSTSCSTEIVVQSLFLLPGLYVACSPITSTVMFSLSVATQEWAIPESWQDPEHRLTSR